MKEYRITIDSPTGELTLIADDTHLLAVGWNYPPLESGGSVPEPRSALLERAAIELDEYFAGTRTRFTLPLCPVGTAFQQRVWHALLEIPYGETRGYGEIAKRIGCASARAVGVAIGRNPLAIVIPCHRVIGASGALTGFGGGLEAKRILLSREGAVPPARTSRPSGSREIRNAR